MPYKFNPFTGNLDQVNEELELEFDEAYVPFGEGITPTTTGRKGQWSYGDGTYWLCIANNIWIAISNKNDINKIIDTFVKSDEFNEMFVSAELITGPNANGIKGQWSYSQNYYYKCIATNTWIRYVTSSSGW